MDTENYTRIQHPHCVKAHGVVRLRRRRVLEKAKRSSGTSVRRAAMTVKRLVDYWLEVELSEGYNKTEAAEGISRACGVTYTLSRVGQWVNGKRDVPRDARAYMVARALPAILEDASIDIKSLTPKQVTKIATALS